VPKALGSMNGEDGGDIAGCPELDELNRGDLPIG
jgi:hypothetical protein